MLRDFEESLSEWKDLEERILAAASLPKGAEAALIDIARREVRGSRTVDSTPAGSPKVCTRNDEQGASLASDEEDLFLATFGLPADDAAAHAGLRGRRGSSSGRGSRRASGATTHTEAPTRRCTDAERISGCITSDHRYGTGGVLRSDDDDDEEEEEEKGEEEEGGEEDDDQGHRSDEEGPDSVFLACLYWSGGDPWAARITAAETRAGLAEERAARIEEATHEAARRVSCLAAFAFAAVVVAVAVFYN